MSTDTDDFRLLSSASPADINSTVEASTLSKVNLRVLDSDSESDSEEARISDELQVDVMLRVEESSYV